MKFPGYWVSIDADKMILTQTTFDETELDPMTDWKQAWQNQDEKSLVKGYVELSDGLMSAATHLAMMAGQTLSCADLDQVVLFEPVWQDIRCEISSLSCLLKT